MRIFVIVIIVLILGGMFISNAMQTDFRSVNSSVIFTKIYISWILRILGNLKDLAAVAYHMDWIPKL